jgi:hypothetical protein
MTKTGDETVDSMFDEIKTVSMRTVNGRHFVADEETIHEMEAMAQADKDWDEILATHRAVCDEERRN